MFTHHSHGNQFKGVRQSEVPAVLAYTGDVGSQHYGPFVVTNTDRQVYTDYIIRQMQVEVSE